MKAFFPCLLFVAFSCLAIAEGPRVASLPAPMADFLVHPESGDLYTVDPNGNTLHRFRYAALDRAESPDAERPQIEADATLKVGSTPVSVAYKRFGSDEFLAVVCTQDTHLYLVDVGTFELKKKVLLPGPGNSQVTSSQNPADPFFYYCFGSGHDSLTGAVDVRSKLDVGQAFDDSMDCAISADGKMAYRRGPWSPSGFESLRLSTEMGGAKPTFVRLFYDHNSTGQYIPGPFTTYTATGTSIYTASLERKVASLDFVPACFFRKRPLICGKVTSNRHRPFEDDGKPMRLKMASYNTLAAVGEPVVIPKLTGKGGAVPRGFLGGLILSALG